MRSSVVKIDEAAFNRGVNEVLQLKPLQRVVRGACKIVAEQVHGSPGSASARQQRDSSATKAGKSRK